MNVEKWPIDVSIVEKGYVIPAEECEKHVGILRTESKYGHALLAFQNSIIKELHRVGKDDILVVVKDYGIAFLDDDDASDYLTDAANNAAKRIRKLHRARLRTVDPEHLTTPQKKLEHEYQVMLGARRVLALRTASKDAKKAMKSPVERQELPEPEE